jgi:hypothetical protein
MTKNRKERRIEKRAAAAEVEPREPETFETEEDANVALSKAARVINMNEKQKEKVRKASRVGNLPALPKLPKGRKEKPEHECECGCGDMTRARFAPGHDSYVRGWAIRVERKVVKFSEVPGPQQPAVKAMIKERALKAKEAAAAEVGDEAIEAAGE